MIVLGDFIDRGPQSADILVALSRATSDHIVVLKGNHEACLVACYRGDERAMDFCRKFGGGATMGSFGMSEEDIATLDSGSLIEALRGAVDRNVTEWVDALPTSWFIWHYYFAHAEIRPGGAARPPEAG